MNFITLTQERFANFNRCPILTFVEGIHLPGCPSKVPFPWASCCQNSRIPAADYTLIGREIAVAVTGETDLQVFKVDNIVPFQLTYSMKDNPEVIYFFQESYRSPHKYIFRGQDITEFLTSSPRIIPNFPLGNYAMIGSLQ